MKIKIFILTLLSLFFITTTVYGANYYSGVKFKNTPSNGDIVVWSDAGNQFEFKSLGEYFSQDSGILVGTGAGTYAEETGATLRTSIGVGTGDSPQFTDLTLTGHVLLPLENDADSPTLAFGDGDSGFYESTDDTINVGITGASTWIMTSSFLGSVASGGILMYDGASATVPFVRMNGDNNTGVGRAAADQLSLIAGGVEGIRITEDTTIAVAIAGDTAVTGKLSATTYGSDGSVSDTELKYINTLSSNAQTQLSVRVIGDASVTDDHVATFNADGYNLQDTLVVISDAGAMTGLTSITVDASTTPGITGYDSDVSDDDVWKIYGSATDANDSVMYFQVEQANALVTYMTFDGVGETVDLAKPLDMGANAITSTGTIDTTGLTTGGVKTVVDADGGDATAYCYGGVWFASGTGTIALPNATAGMQITIENHTALDVTIEPLATGTDDTIRLNGVALTQGHNIVGTDLGDGCVCTYYAADTWSCFCSGYEDGS